MLLLAYQNLLCTLENHSLDLAQNCSNISSIRAESQMTKRKKWGKNFLTWLENTFESWVDHDVSPAKILVKSGEEVGEMVHFLARIWALVESCQGEAAADKRKWPLARNMGDQVSKSPTHSLFEATPYWEENLESFSKFRSLKIGHFRRLGDFRVSRLRPQNLECNFGLSWFSENRKMQFSLQMVLLFGNKSSNLTHYGAPVAISVPNSSFIMICKVVLLI